MAFQAKTEAKIDPKENNNPVASTGFNVHAYFNQAEIDYTRNTINDILGSLTRSRSSVQKEFLLKLARDNFSLDMQNKPHFSEMLNFVLSNLEITYLGKENNGMITHKDIVSNEKEILALVSIETDQHILNKKIIDRAIFNKKGISEEQTEAVLAACSSNERITVIEGSAGAGKSFTMQAIKEAYLDSGYDVRGTALSWNASKVLEQSAGIANCESLEALLRKIEKSRTTGIEYFRKPTLLVVDEAGLIGTKNMWRLLKETSTSRMPVKIVLTGDSTQLAPVEAGNALEAIVDYCGSTRIDTIRRQKQISHRKAVKFFQTGQAGKGLYIYQQQEAIKWFDEPDNLFKAIVQDCLSYKLANPKKKCLVLALSNKDVQKINQMLRDCYQKLGQVSEREYAFNFTDMKQSWKACLAEGDHICFRKNDKNKVINMKDVSGNIVAKSVGLFNRTTGVVTKIKPFYNDRGLDYAITVDLDGGGYVDFTAKEYMGDGGLPICHNFATTIYASQGQTVEKVLFIDSPMISRRLAYVGMSRHTESCDIYFDKKDLASRLDKLTGKTFQEDEIPDPTRYSYAEMLQVAAHTWAKDVKNQTALMMLKDREESKNEKKKFQECLVERDESVGDEIDFVEDFNVDPRKIDVDYFIKLEKPKAPKEEIPTIISPPVATPAPQEPSKNEETKTPKKPKGIWNFIVSSLGGVHVDETPAKVHIEDDASIFSRHTEHKPASTPVEKNLMNEKQSHSQVEVKTLDTKNLSLIDKKAVTANKKVEIVYLPEEPKLTHIKGDTVIFSEQVKLKPSAELLARFKKQYWDNGRNQEMRFLAKHQNKVMSRYTIDGVDTLKFGYPLLLPNPKQNAQTPVYIVCNPLDLLYTHEHFQKVKTDKSTIPHFVWGAKDANLRLIMQGLKNRTIVITRSKTDDSQIPWALDIQKKLEQLNIDATITPKIEPEVSLKPKI